MTQNEFDKIRKEIATASFCRKRKCFITDCNQTAIQSHLVQRKGILNHLITNGHLYEVAFLQYPQAHYNIKRIGWKEALTFPGFCAQHDSQIFEPIERGNINYADYQSLLLLMYRPLLHEYRQKEMVTEALVNSLFDNRLKSLPLNRDEIQDVIAGETIMMWDIKYLLLSLQEDLTALSKSFSFHAITLPKIDICVAGAISFTSLAETFLTDPIDLSQKEPMPAMLFNLIPSTNETKLILGYHNLAENYLKTKIEFFKNLDTPHLLKEVSDILIRNCGKWSCSEAFYLDKIKPRETSLLKLMNHFIKREQFSKETIDFNLFKQ